MTFVASILTSVFMLGIALAILFVIQCDNLKASVKSLLTILGK